MFDFLFNKPKYFIVFLKKNNNSFDVLKQRRIKNKELRDNTVQFRSISYLIDTTNICCTKGVKHYIVVDVDGSQLTLKEQPAVVSAEIVDEILNKSIISQFAAALHVESKAQMGPIAISLIILCTGILLGYLIGNIFPFEELSNAVKNFKLW